MEENTKQMRQTEEKLYFYDAERENDSNGLSCTPNATKRRIKNMVNLINIANRSRHEYLKFKLSRLSFMLVGELSCTAFSSSGDTSSRIRHFLRAIFYLCRHT